jgi:uncharacterized membrane protein
VDIPLNEKTRKIVIAGMLTGIMLVFELSGIGYPEIPPFALTIMHVPVAVGAMVLGPWYGLYFGALFGLTSMWHAARTGLPSAFLFLDVRVALLPRLIVPLAAYMLFRLVDKMLNGKSRLISGAAGGVAAALTNTVLVLGAVYIFYAPQAAPLFGVGDAKALLYALLTVAGTSGLVEAAVAGVLSGPIMAALSKMKRG